ncbi:5'-nucleotidase SurE [Limihaloglobus sulfuriphilus]|uniref:5'-nucleotidase SurE n=1 Tax=Limihaloglobus sulfuriphilus TaxID=1851148 RepID=A0A1Q2MGV6_9BACT|nr:5'/3'-nucleotidase SurE [Limihaloglobus sulfuriphilus]AQQ71884.1 5'-nucleotidase SurE [Limihaloglobus sulfuriphilus]
MNILLTNDDGISANGLTMLCERLSELGNVFVAAPREHMSAAGHGLSLGPIDVEQVEVIPGVTGFSINGTPADCVKLAILELVDEPIDLVVSGLNNGTNLGVNIWYSGTVAAAREACFYGIPAVALSTQIHNPAKLKPVCNHALHLLKKLLPLEAGIYNINIPHEPVLGMKVLPQSTVNFHEAYKRVETANGLYYQVVMKNEQPQMPRSDVEAFEEGYITITPLTINQTSSGEISKLEKRINTVKIYRQVNVTAEIEIE